MVKEGARPCVSPWLELISYVSETILLFPAPLQYPRKVSRVDPETATAAQLQPCDCPEGTMHVSFYQWPAVALCRDAPQNLHPGSNYLHLSSFLKPQ